MSLNTPTKDFDDGVDLGNRKHLRPLPSSPLQITTHRAQTSGFKCDNNYHPDSSLFAASVTSPAPNALSLAPHHPNFPPATLDSLNNFRREAQASPHDLALQLNFAKYLMEAVQQVQINDAARSTKAKTAMLSEAQRIVKTLAMKSRIGRSGYAEALFYLANAYGAGLMLLSVNHDKAFHLYLQGSKQCHPGCTYRAGVCYELGLGTRRDNARAIRFYRKAANLSDPSAMYKLAMILLHGLLGQAKHPKEAISWLKRAAPLADAYHPEILHELGLVYENDSIPSVIPDQDYTRELVTKAARFGYAPSQYKLGLAYENGLWNCPIDARRSIAW
jgi:TPR repeat protein